MLFGAFITRKLLGGEIDKLHSVWGLDSNTPSLWENDNTMNK
jgi:hypothetical protein